MLKKIFLVLILVLIPLCLLATEPRTVVVISIDALHPDAISIAKPKNILYLMGKGVYSLNGKSETPPKTLINHTAMVVGKSPEESGYNFNNWKIGDRKVSIDTIFHDAKKAGYKTFYVYSKQNLGFLENDGIDKSYFAEDESVYLGQKIVEETKYDYFLFLHISGLDFIGPKYGWLSSEYIEEFKMIDEDIAPIIQKLLNKKNTTLIITSDHGGHEKIHGSEHPEDYKFPIIIYSDMAGFDDLKDKNYKTSQLRSYLKRVFAK